MFIYKNHCPLQFKPPFIFLIMNIQLFYLLFLLVIASGFRYTYSSATWKKIYDNNSTIIDNYIPSKEGIITNLISSNNLKFSIQDNNASAAYIQANAFLPPFLFDGSIIPDCTIENIPMRFNFFPQQIHHKQINHLHEKAIIKSVTFKFYQSYFSISMEGSIYEFDMTYKEQMEIKFCNVAWMVFLWTSYFMQIAVIIFSIYTNNVFQYRCLVIFNTISGYEIFILLKNVQLSFLDNSTAMVLSIFSSGGTFVALVMYIFKPLVSWQRLLIVFLLMCYSSLIALGYIGDTFIFTEMFLQQAYIAISERFQRRNQFINTDSLDSFIFIVSTAICRIISIAILHLIFGSQYFDFGKIYLCLLFLIFIGVIILQKRRQKRLIIYKFKEMIRRNLWRRQEEKMSNIEQAL